MSATFGCLESPPVWSSGAAVVRTRWAGARRPDLRRPLARSKSRAIQGASWERIPSLEWVPTGSASRDPLPVASSPPITHAHSEMRSWTAVRPCVASARRRQFCRTDEPRGGRVGRTISLTVNGRRVEEDVEPRLLLAQFLREQLGLTGTHIGCDTSSCGACTVHVDGDAVKSCTVLAVQADGSSVVTIEGLGAGGLHPMQQAFHERHALQCGYCTPGMIMAAVHL